MVEESPVLLGGRETAGRGVYEISDFHGGRGQLADRRRIHIIPSSTRSAIYSPTEPTASSLTAGPASPGSSPPGSSATSSSSPLPPHSSPSAPLLALPTALCRVFQKSQPLICTPAIWRQCAVHDVYHLGISTLEGRMLGIHTIDAVAPLEQVFPRRSLHFSSVSCTFPRHPLPFFVSPSSFSSSFPPP